MPEQSLKEKTIRGVGWSAADAFLAQGVSFIVGLVLARLLSPEEYGLIGIVTIFTTVLLGIIDCGFSNALIRKIKVTEDDYSTLFIFNTIISLVMYGILYVGAPFIAHFFERPQLEPLTRVMGLLLIFQTVSIVQYTILSRDIDFKTKTKASLISAIISGIIGIAMAILGYGVWALVFQQLSRQLLYSVFLWMYIKWLPKLSFSVDSFKYMWGFGWKLLVSGLLDRIWAQLYQVVVGKFYSPASLGQYSRAKEYANIFSSNLTTIVQRVSFPVLSQVQNDEERMVLAYRRVIKTTMFITAVILIFMAAISEPFIYCLIGPQWLESATYLPLICLSMSLYPLHAINLNMLQIQGRTDIFLYLEILKKIIAIGPICLGIFINIYWMLIGTIVTGVLAFFMNSYYTGKKLGYSSWMQLKDIAPSYGIALVIAISVYFFKYLSISNWIVLPIQLLVGALVFVCVCERTNLDEYKEVKNMFLQYLSKIKIIRKQ